VIFKGKTVGPIFLTENYYQKGRRRRRRRGGGGGGVT
jgi:hypothetical protein